MSGYQRYECLTVEVAEKVATVTLNRPQARNAINQKLIRELRTIWDDLADDHAVNAGEFHEQDVIFEDSRVRGIVGADEWIVPGGDLSLAGGVDVVRVEVVHRPVPTPVVAVWPGDVPGHVIDHQDF